MRKLTEKEFKLFESLCKLSQPSLQTSMFNFLKEKYPKGKVTYNYHYVTAEGDIPIALVAHMDTVWAEPSEEILYDEKKNIMWGVGGTGFDDRTGVFLIIQIIKAGLRPHIIFTTDEEKGCVGASVLGAKKMPFADLRYVIELDRRGTNDCVFYDCDNRNFVDYVEGFGFVEALGSFTDISEICENWKVAGVNLSVGYKDEHTNQERQYVSAMWDTYNKVVKMLKETDIPKFEYIPCAHSYSYLFRHLGNASGMHEYDPYADVCDNCGKSVHAYELMPVLDEIGHKDYICMKCYEELNIGYCEKCKEGFIRKKTDPKATKCARCALEEVIDAADKADKK